MGNNLQEEKAKVAPGERAPAAASKTDLDEIRLPKHDPSSPYRVSPPRGVENPNRSSQFPSLAVNGIRMTVEAIEKMGSLLALKRGHDVVVIPNISEGTLEDLANCVKAAFSDERGVEAEKTAAGNLARNLIGRLNDTEPVVVDAYSQGTLITRNVLAFVRAHLLAEGREGDWNSLASRLQVQTYGAAVRIWPKGVENVVEYRHSGDPVAAVGVFVSANKALQDLLHRQLGARSKVIVIPQLSESHSINKYLQNNPRFLVASLSGATAEERGKELTTMMAQGELSNFEHSRTMDYLARVAKSEALPIGKTNNAILMLRSVLSELEQNPNIASLLSSELRSEMREAADQRTRRKATPPERRQRGGKYRFN